MTSRRDEGDKAASKMPAPKRTSLAIRRAMEVVVSTVVVVSPWLYGGAHSGFEFLIDVGIALLLALWGARMLVDGQLSWRACPVAFCLAALFLYGLIQLIPLSPLRLAWLSPGAAKTYQQILPAEREVLPSNLSRDSVTPVPGSTISLYPTATRQMLIRLLVVFLLFVAVQNNLASIEVLRRIATMAVLNGALLTLFGFLQFFSSPSNTLYWSYPTLGQVFGPFINRNHFAMYINLCIGLGLGLLLDGRISKPRTHAGEAWFEGSAIPWIVFALSLMVGGVAFSLSRGGMIALGIGLTLCAAIVMIRSRQLARLLPILVGVACGTGLIAWFGFGAIEARLATLWDADISESRLPIWLTTLRITQDFPILGTGFGTFASIEPMYRDYAERVGFLAVHVHNEYLEALAEGGVVRLVFTLAAVGWVIRLGMRAVGNRVKSQTSGLALGALTAIVMLAIHSIVEFGIHVPAIAVLATVLAAQLATLTTAEQRADVQMSGLAPWIGCVTVFVLGLVIVNEGWRRHCVEWSLYLSARPTDSGTPTSPPHKIQLLSTAARFSPHDVRIQLEIAKARFDVFDHEEESGTSFAAELTAKHLAPGLRSLLHARDACPLLAEPHVLLALYADRFLRADSRSAYWQRVKLLAPTDPDVWYLCGQQELLLDHAYDQAWTSWKRSLELGDRRLPEILIASAEHLSPSEISQKVLPERANVLIRAAELLFPAPADGMHRRPLFERALAVLETQTEPFSADEWHLKAQLFVRLGQSESALPAYQAALAERPLQIDWRYEFAKTLFDLGRLQDSRRELRLILGQQPKHAAANVLENEITRAMAEGRTN